MFNHEKVKIRYITDAKGEKTEVVLPIKAYNELIEDLNDLAIVAERRDEESISHEALIKKLRKDEKL